MMPTPQRPSPCEPIPWNSPASDPITARSIEQPIGTIRSADGSYQCFRCRYDLTIAGEAGRCPECGQRFDKDLDSQFTLTQRLVMAPFRAWEACQLIRAAVNDLPRAAIQDRDWWSEKFLPSSRTVVSFVLVVGNAAIVITLAVLGFRALFGTYPFW